MRKPASKLKGTVGGLYRTEGKGFVTTSVETLELGFEGIAGDEHGGPTRRTGGREPWYPRGTKIRNERQLSILSFAELGEVARDLDIPELLPEWIGANLVLDGIPRLSHLPPRTLLFFESGVTLKVDGDNGPCRLSGRSIAAHHPGREDIEFSFVRAAKHKRGLVAWVEKPGRLSQGEAFEARLPEQWIYDPA
ncbi:MOSC domain-containing protein [Aureimonas sp. AU40]|uniref:MOSC domain-containing protein n=1 Tax=Aureimonas sp. AU40 TaxID=1637747 RepID=UPI0007817DDC|nr:molybdenum cofactor sulfurase [Aureimonas sp. AU40]